MLFLLDEQLSRKLIAWFSDKGHEAVHVEDALGPASGDSAIVRFAKARQAIIVSKDSDFQDLLASFRTPRSCSGSASATPPRMR